MAAACITSPFTKDQSRSNNDGWDETFSQEEEKMSPELRNLLLSLPKEMDLYNGFQIYNFQNFWCHSRILQAIVSFQQHFQAKDNDIIVATIPKSGTTWLKALAFAIAKRHYFSPSHHDHPLHHSNPHTLVPFFEAHIYLSNNNNVPNLSNFSEPRIFGTHIPFASLPDSIKISNCKIIYICRNPLDTFVSRHFYLSGINKEKSSSSSSPIATIEQHLEDYCKGINAFGPFWSHMLGYWKESKNTHNKVMFLKYEDLKEDTKFHVKRMAEFLDCPFSLEEESNGVIEDIIQLCSLKKMMELEVNKSGKYLGGIAENKHFFRKGEIGDWVNHLSPKMVEKLSNIIQEKLGGSGLSFKFLPN